LLPLPFILQKDTICHYRDTTFFIGDRRCFPFQKSEVALQSFDEIGQALKNMVTQGGGPLQVALTCFEFCAHLFDQGLVPNRIQTFSSSLFPVVTSRPTNTTMKREVASLLTQVEKLYPEEQLREGFVEDVIKGLVGQIEHEIDCVYDQMARWGASLIADGDTILTTCFAEHTFLLSVLYAQQQGKKVSVIANETRPYLQGARLTIPCLMEMGIPCQLICDGMGAHFMREGLITKYMTAADLVTMDGTVVNKTGTLANAIAAKHYGISYIPFSMSPDTTKKSASDITMEMRDPQEVLHAFDSFTTLPNAAALYPAFDIIDHNLVSKIVTNQGIFTPEEIGAVYL
jgi:methylthioribose-1-phosphate isomerase